MNPLAKILISAAVALGLMLAAFSKDPSIPEDPWQIRPRSSLPGGHSAVTPAPV